MPRFTGRTGRRRFCAVDWFDDEHHDNEHGVDRAYPAEIRHAERHLLRDRRRGEAASGEAAAPQDERPPVAVGLSGGGIRSATFCLGFFQGLAKLNPAALPRPHGDDDEAAAAEADAELRERSLLGRLDVLSSASGGGYFGAFFGRFFQPRGAAATPPGDAPPPDRLPAVERSLADNFSREIGWLRENGRYLAPNGSGDALLAGAVIFRNWVALQLVLATFLQAAFLALQGIVYGAGAAIHAAGFADLLAQVQEIFQGSEPFWVWRSPLLMLPFASAILAVAPAAWAYWMLPSRKRRDQLRWRGLLVRFPSFAAITAFLAAASIVLILSLSRLSGVASDEAQVISAVAATLGLIGALAFGLWLFYYRPWRPVEVLEAAAPGARTALSKFLRFWLFTTVGLLALAMVDGLGQTLYAAAIAGDGAVRALLVGLFGGGSLLAEAVRRLIKLIGGRLKKGGAQKGGSYLHLALILIAAAAVIAIALVASTLSHALTWAFQPPNVPVDLAFLESGGYVRPARSINLIVCGFLFFSLVSFGIARTYSFLNYSSHHLMYAARLTRAYLGASNPARHEQGIKVTDVHPDDNLPDLRQYAPHAWGGPLHLVNVTVNETISGRSNVQQQDRKGLGLAAGPCGFSAGKSHHAMWHGDRRANGVEGRGFRVFPHLGDTGFAPEPLSLGQWVAISGAAFTTGAGVRTSLPMALLAGLANVRLGYWWDSGIEPSDRAGTKRTGASPLTDPSASTAGLLRGLFPTQMHLVDEMTARFRGPSVRRWYLSDGGHFENLGGYELIRRRFPVVLLLDAEADPEYSYEGLAGLVRKARIDFGAEIRFLDQVELETLFEGKVPRAVGTLGDLSRDSREGCSKVCTALAVVEHPAPPAERPKPVSLLVYVKAALCEDAPLDLAEYHRNHPDFPHESTGDQFFDEAQWESYRRLGEWQAMTLFGPDGWDLLAEGGERGPLEALIERMNQSLEHEPADLPGSEEG
ncbi:MAG TPA: hypothetical protein VKU40_04445 [Thermoanaerobaculia bacterium]|nr:hypothetical protein [Thermoanaerobaculia bacterium]